MTKTKTTQQQRTKSSSAEGLANKFANVQTTVPLPGVVSFTSQIEVDLWEYVTAARSYEDWRDIDLMLLWKWVMLEKELLDQQELVVKEGAVVQGARGGPIENPRIRIMNLYETRQLSIYRALGLNVTKSDPRVIKRNQVEEQKARRILQGADDLLAGSIMN